MRDGVRYRVLAIAADAFTGYGGIAQSTQDLLLALSKADEIGSIDILPRVESKSVGLVAEGIYQHRALRGRVAFTVAAIRLAKSIRPDVVYCGHVFMAPLAAAISILFGAKLVIHLHGIEIWEPLSLFRRLAVECADLVLCVSNDTKNRVLTGTRLSPDRTVVIYNTVDEAFKPGDRVAARRSFDLRDERALLTVSRLDSRQRHKGHDDVIALIPRLRALGHNVIYLIAGDGDDRPRLEGLAASHGVSDHVRFLGRVPQECMPDLYRAADLYVMPSSGEGFGIAFVEAMASGTPSLGLAVGGATDALRNGVLGVATSKAEFPLALFELVERTSLDPQMLSSAARLKFGRTAFEARVHQSVRQLFSDRRSVASQTENSVAM